MKRIAANIVENYGNRDNFLRFFNPDAQMKLCGNPDLCFFGGFPTLGQINTAYGRNTATAWLVPQLVNLSNYSGCRDKLKDDEDAGASQLLMCASVIATEFHYLSVTEIMLFFHRFKAGRYGRFYGAVDPLVITTSLRDFLPERVAAYNLHEKEERERAEEEDSHNVLTADEWYELRWLFNMGYEPWRIKKELMQEAIEREKQRTHES